MLSFLYKIMVLFENESLEVKVQPKYGKFSSFLWWALGRPFSISVCYKDACLVKCSKTCELPLMIRIGMKSKIDTDKVKVKIEKC